MSRRLIQSQQIPRYPNGAFGFTFNRLALPIVRYRLGRLFRRAKKAEAKVLARAAAV